MPHRTDLVYRYDGSLDGFFCCVYHCVYSRELPCAIEPLDSPQETLFPVREIETQEELARRVEASIRKKISQEAYYLVRDAFLSILEEKERKLLRFLIWGYREGPKVTAMLADPRLHEISQAVLHARHEAHLFTGFLRFSDHDGFLIAQITPKNSVLPLIAPHFCERFSGENFLIWDKAHRMGFIHEKSGEYRFFRAEQLRLQPPDENELQCRELWKKFYETIAIEDRKNPRLRSTHCPKRYWQDMTEFQASEAQQQAKGV